MGMITLHGEEVKVGDRVWHWFKGWGEVTELDEKNSNYPICVQWEEDGDYDWFTEDGKFHKEDRAPTLFWQPLEYEIPKKPKPKEKAWQWVCRSGRKYWITNSFYGSKEEVLEGVYAGEPIEPYLPSEIEREVKE